ncbi:glycosyltransferase family 2 protein [Sphingomonas sp. BIUV-7]|uniref:Glycosyltransferase family 2 protein n=1 Tax=Sphingomonas natans TaxID=3063330 RepID=A0ABT8Y4L7_9SPHN|nr:glycosyltransferase family 2 protein [Sphingomonas sp. BIUV-7]MDO6413267.1 glycosyltransferase family 2 protein [Sphingomonas sp. BIUV-7]
MRRLIRPKLAIVVIGRNEGERLKACLRSVIGEGPVVYVDSGSSDGSQDFAHALGAKVIQIDVPHFTAARARNAGASFVQEPQFLQFIDGDCEMQPGWIAKGMAALEADPSLALVFGRRRERHPEASVYNALCDDEWDVPVGEVGACGGDILIREVAYRAVGGYPEDMIAGEEPDMSMRLRAAGWRLARIEGEMTLHDAAIMRFGQWWRRTKRAGHAFAELAWRHPRSTWPNWSASVWRDVIWGGLIPALAMLGIVGGLFRPVFLLITAACIALFLVNIARIYRRRLAEGLPPRLARASAVLLMIGKIPEFAGFVAFHRERRSGRKAVLIEYKDTTRA